MHLLIYKVDSDRDTMFYVIGFPDSLTEQIKLESKKKPSDASKASK